MPRLCTICHHLDRNAIDRAGVKPAGDDFLDPSEVADPSFGCNFTNGAHPFGTACP